MTESETHASIFKLGVLVVIGMVVQLGVIAYVFWSQYEGRKDAVASLRAGCERSKKDRADNARAAIANATNWNQASAIRKKDGDKSVAIVYAGNARKQELSAISLMKRAGIDCTKAYPKARILR